MPFPEKDDEVKSRREVLEEAFDEAAEAAPDDDSAAPRAEGKLEEGGVRTAKKDDAGDGARGDGEGKGKEGEVDEAAKPQRSARVRSSEKTPDQKEAEAAAAADKGVGGGTADAAPGAWKPAAREEWSKIPANARAEISRRELAIQRELTQTANVRRLSNDLATIVQPHLELIRAQNSTPLAAIDSLMKTASRLFRGSPQEKAQVIFEVMQNYGVDVVQLDKLLSGKAELPPNMKPGGAPDNNPPAWARPIFGFMQTVEQQRVQRDQELNAQVEADVEVARNTLPFYEDLREDMADILESAARRGKVVTMQQAYDRAVAADPEISMIISQRKTAAAQNGNGVSARARRAASTISGAPRGGVQAKQGRQSRRDVLSDAWDEKAG